MRVAVVGAHGQLGAAVVREFADGQTHQVVALAHGDLDVTRDAEVSAVIDRLRPDAIINCVGYNDVDGAEDHPVDALNINAFTVRALARAAVDVDALLVHFSTDFVFDGTASAPYSEDDRPNPRSVYSTSKLLGEWFAEDAPKRFILRVESLFGRAPGARPAKGSVAGIVRALTSGREQRVFEDRVISPTYVLDAAWATRRLLEMQPSYGIYHCVNSGRGTWLEVARELAGRLDVEPRLVPVRLRDVSLRAERPVYCALSNEKLAAAGIPMPTWQDAVARYSATVRDELADKMPNG
jgi:dTDP-4-dehydrorhamnose reductase